MTTNEVIKMCAASKESKTQRANGTPIVKDEALFNKLHAEFDQSGSIKNLKPVYEKKVDEYIKQKDIVVLAHLTMVLSQLGQVSGVCGDGMFQDLYFALGGKVSRFVYDTDDKGYCVNVSDEDATAFHNFLD